MPANLPCSSTAKFAALLDKGRPPLLDRSHGNANSFQQAVMTWRKLSMPVIAAFQGVSFGGGLQIPAWQAD